ncbi:hypothetical protein A3K63_00565 [Candidatus Micrarchaeota archaeon RBG_16_49_10]|nr:MAG: hypothetical protein A3K63_00565 [Candidatus Micrarchaeota archaeon RBG_16_49_10]
MIDILVFSFIGLLVGLVAGLTPGVHPNQVFVILISLMPFLSKFTGYGLIAFILAVATSNIVFNYIPAIFLSVPDPETVVNVLPGHRMVLEGKGLDALFISLCGSFFTLIFCIIMLPILIFFIPILNNHLYPYLHYLLAGLTLWMILLEKSWKKMFCSILLYVISGFWGILTLNSVMISADKALFPSLTGMFGVAGILLSLNEQSKIPKQIADGFFEVGNIKKIVLSSLIAGLLIGVLPGAGESQAGVLMSCITRMEQKEFLGSLAGINSSNMFFALISLYSFDKIRSGSSAAIKEVVDVFTAKELLFSIGVVLFSAGFSVLFTWFLGKKCLTFLETINYKVLSIWILVFTVLMVLILSGLVGIFILIISTCIGILPIAWGVKRTSNMGYLMLTTTLYFAGFTWLVYGLIY